MLKKEEVINRFKEIHGDKYDYSKVDFKKVTDKVTIICPKHGEFQQIARQHYRGQGCPLCSVEYRTDLKRDDTSSFIEKAKKVHGDKYDYSKVEYVNSLTKVCIICPDHGEFMMRPDSHINGQGCPDCANLMKGSSARLSAEEFIKKSIEKHGDFYDYSCVNYINNHTLVKIICPEHGEFMQNPASHLRGSNCPLCAGESRRRKNTETTESFIEKAQMVHGIRYDYSQVKYVNVHTPVKIICPEHGEFMQKPVNHLGGCGCQICGSLFSHYEKEIVDFIKSIAPNLVIATNERTVLNNMELDIYIPDKKLAIEFDGLYWHSEVKKPSANYHLDKTTACESIGIQLIHIFEDEWLYKKEICKSRLMSLLGVSPRRIYARDCEVKHIDSKTYQKFFKENHIQGSVTSKVALGLFYHNELVSAMSFGGLRKNLGRSNEENSYELLRFANTLNTNVVGGASRLFAHFYREYNPEKIISYADRRWSMGNLYDKLGFMFKHNSKPSYFYVINDKRYNRFSFRKDILISKYGCSPNETEHSFCLKNHWYRIYDCGTKLYEWFNKKPETHY